MKFVLDGGTWKFEGLQSANHSDNDEEEAEAGATQPCELALFENSSHLHTSGTIKRPKAASLTRHSDCDCDCDSDSDSDRIADRLIRQL